MLFFPIPKSFKGLIKVENRPILIFPCGHGVDKMTKNDSVLMNQAKNKKQVKLLIT